MKIILFGYGKMGKLIEKIAHKENHEITGRYSQHTPLQAVIEKADVVIDFSHPQAVINHLQLSLEYNKPIVIGTTGWEEHLPAAQKMVQEAQGACIYSPNFSIGVYLFRKLVRKAAVLLQPFPDYDVCGIEYHHRQKLDSPSGTAKALSNEIHQHLSRVSSFNFTSVRSGSYPGTHILSFDSPADTITLTHEARTRDGFALGALSAAQWILNKKGFFTMDDFIEQIHPN